MWQASAVRDLLVDVLSCGDDPELHTAPTIICKSKDTHTP